METDEFGDVQFPLQCVSESEDEPDSEPHPSFKELISENRTTIGSVNVDGIDASGKTLTSLQHEDYLFRPPEFKDYSLFEFVMTVQKVLITDPGTQSGPGRPKAKRFNFQSQHSLAATHCCQIMAKQTVPDIVKRMPTFPGNRPVKLTQTWKWKARMFAANALILYRPWNGPAGIPVPETLTWKAFIEWAHSLRTSGFSNLSSIMFL